MKTSKDVIDQDLEYICHNLQEEFDSMASSQFLITGGAGFLGYYLVQAILHWNKDVETSKRINITVLDNFMRGIPDWLKGLGKDKYLSIINHDIAHRLPANTSNFKYKYIIHAASIASPIYYRKHPIETMDANVNGLRLLLDYCRKQTESNNSIKGLLFFSTSEIYGDPLPQHIPTPESYRGNVSCTGPRACYDESKRYGETLSVNFARQYGLPVKIARPFNNYGPGLKITDRRVLPDIVRDALRGRNINLFSNGSPTRTFCYIADAIIGYYKILTRGRSGEAYNIGVDYPEISIKELAEKVIVLAGDLFEYKGKIIYEKSADCDYLVDNPNRRCPDITKAKKELGYDPCISIQEGLTRSLIWYADNREAEEA